VQRKGATLPSTVHCFSLSLLSPSICFLPASGAPSYTTVTGPTSAGGRGHGATGGRAAAAVLALCPVSAVLRRRWIGEKKKCRVLVSPDEATAYIPQKPLQLPRKTARGLELEKPYPAASQDLCVCVYICVCVYMCVCVYVCVCVVATTP